jgi:hypothetical protein
LPLEVSFTYAAGHPTAPARIQQLVGSLAFAPIAVSTERANER